MRLILPGEFKMGSPEHEKERYESETQHEVTLTEGFWLADTACTQELWEAVMRKNPAGFKGRKRPVETVSWDECQAFFEKVRKLKPDMELSFPTEAQWEYACRAGTETPFSFGENITTDQVNYKGNRPYADGKKGKDREETVDVKFLPCNDWGLYQMHGNVWEWCSDWYGDYPKEPTINPGGLTDGVNRVCRGGSWFSSGRFARSAYRGGDEPSLRSSNLGFRFSQVFSSSSKDGR
jgi:formylglycine-generating enzyme required for sulfatase activity